ncbi:MAG: U-box domain-containing protein [Candidatus Amoebophilus sp.]
MYVNNNKKLVAQLLLATFILESCHSSIPVITEPKTRTKTKSLTLSHNPAPILLYTSNKVIDDKNGGTNQELYMPMQPTAQQASTQPFNTSNTNEATNLEKVTPNTLEHWQSLPIKQKASDIRRVNNNRQLNANHTMISRLTNQVCIANGGCQVAFQKKEDSGLQAIVEDKYATGSTRQILPVHIQPGINYSEIAIKNPIWQKLCIHIIKGYVYVGHIGLLGGDEDKISHPEKESEHKIEQIQAFIGEAAKNAEKAKSKDIVLVLGNTGVGKSAAVNYLLGTKMKFDTNDEGDRIAVTRNPQEERAKIGRNNFESETFFPNVYCNSAAASYVYCDTPGFNDTRTEEEQLNATIATQLIISCAEAVRAIIVVIDIQDLTTGKGKGMRELSLTLSRLLKSDIAPNSILFVFNDKNGSEINLDNIHKKIDSLKKTEIAKLEKLQKSMETGGKAMLKEYKRLQQTLPLLEILSSSKDNTFKINLFDDFKSKQCIEKLIQNTQSTPKDKFNFSDYDEVRANFNKQLAEVLDKITCKLCEFVNAHKDIDLLNSTIESCNERIIFYKDQLRPLNLQQKIQEEEQIPILEKKIKNYEQDIEVLTRKRQPPRVKVNSLENEKADLEKDREILYKETRIIYCNEFVYNGPPFTRVKIRKGKIPGTGLAAFKPQLKSEFIDKENGIYRANLAIYSPYAHPGIRKMESYFAGTHKVLIYIQARNHPDNKARIQQIERILAEEGEKIAAFNREIMDLESSRDITLKLLETYKTNIQKQKKQLEDKRKSLEANLGRIQRENQEAIVQKAKQEKIRQEAEKYLTERGTTIAAIYNLIAHGITSNEVNVIEKFKEYYQHYQSILDQGPNYIASLHKINYPDHLICPLTQELFLDPVVTPCGHSFSHQELLKWLNTQKSCPNCREPVKPKRLCPNVSLRQVIEKLLSSRNDKN